jgi:rhodanese-related sulfurtransferase
MVVKKVHITVIFGCLFTCAVADIVVPEAISTEGIVASDIGPRVPTRVNNSSTNGGEAGNAASGRVIHIDLGYPQFVAVSIPVAGREHRPVRSVRTSCDCAQVLAHDTVLDHGKPFEALLRVAPSAVGQFRYDVEVEAEDGMRLTRSVDVVATATEKVVAVRLAPRVAEPTGKPSQSLWTDMISDGAQILDVRPAPRFALGHVPGSINLPRYQVRRIAGSPSMPVIVVGDGYDDESLIASLPSSGESVGATYQVLRGGMSGWIRRGGEVSGTGADRASALVLSAAELLPLLGRPEVRWVDVGSDDTARSPRRLHVRGLETVPSAVLEASLKSGVPVGTAPGVIVVCGGGGHTATVLSAALAKDCKFAVYAIDGGLTALEQELDRTLRMSGKRSVRVAGGAGIDPARSMDRGRVGGCCGRSGP